MNKFNLINYLRLRSSPLFILNKKNIYPTSDLFFWHSNLKVKYMLLNENFIFQDIKKVSICLYILDKLGEIILKENINPSKGIFTEINISDFLINQKSNYGSFCIFQTLNHKKYARSERGYIYYDTPGGKSSLMHGNFDAVTLNEKNIKPSSSSTFFPRKFFVQNLNISKFPSAYVFSNPTKKKQKIKVFNHKNQLIDKFLLKSLGIIIREPYDSETIYVKSFMPLCRPLIINDLFGSNFNIFHA